MSSKQKPQLSKERRDRIRSVSRCFWCGSPTGPFTVGWIIPFSIGGMPRADNLVCSCVTCTESRGAVVRYAKTIERFVKREELRLDVDRITRLAIAIRALHADMVPVQREWINREMKILGYTIVGNLSIELPEDIDNV